MGRSAGGAQNGIFCAMVNLWRMRGEFHQPRTAAPGYEKYEGGLRGRSADLERSWTLTSIPASAAHSAASWQSAFCTCGFWRKPRCRRCAIAKGRALSRHSFGGELGHTSVDNRSTPSLPRRHQAGTRQLAVLDADVIEILRAAHQAVDDALAGGDAALYEEYRRSCGSATTRPPPSGSPTTGCGSARGEPSRLRARLSGCATTKNRCGCSPRSSPPTGRTTAPSKESKLPSRDQAVSGYWHTQNPTALNFPEF